MKESTGDQALGAGAHRRSTETGRRTRDAQERSRRSARGPRVRSVGHIPGGIRGSLEALFGCSFSDVIIAVSDAPARLGVRAFAYGNTVFVNYEDAALDNRERWEILGHELAHVVQQRHGRACGQPGEAVWRLHDAALEHEAQVMGLAAADAIEKGGWVPPLPREFVPVAMPVIQCVMSLDEFKASTKSASPRIIDRVSVIDDEVKKFHKIDAARPRKYGDLYKQSLVIYQASRKFLSDKPNSPRAAGVSMLVKQVVLESKLLEHLSDFEEETDDLEKFKSLEKAQEFLQRNRGKPELARRDVINEVVTLINVHANAMKKAGGSDSLLVLRDIDKLKKLATDPTTPGVLQSVILETTAPANLQQIDTTVMTPGLKYNTTRGPGAKKYTLKHFFGQHLGRRFRMGSLLHELTHLSNAEIFDNTCLMLSIRKTATDAQMRALASKRRGNLMSLRSEIESSNAVSGDLREELISKVGYPIGGKFASYLTTFKPQIAADVHARLKSLQAMGLDCELIEYDSVVNQMFLWCHLFDVDPSSGVYTKLKSMVEDAFRYRQSERLMARPLPVPPARPAPPPAIRKPLPPLPVRR